MPATRLGGARTSAATAWRLSTDGTTASTTSILKQVLTTDVAGLTAALDVADPTRARGRSEVLVGIHADETTPRGRP